MPATDVQARNRITCLRLIQCGWSLLITIEMVGVDRSHPRIVQMTGAMPDAVLLLDSHVAHLHRQKVFDHRLPDASLINVRRDLKGLSAKVAILRDVHARLGDSREIELQVTVTKKFAPIGRL